VRIRGDVTSVTSVTSFSITSLNARAREAINGKRQHARHARHRFMGCRCQAPKVWDIFGPADPNIYCRDALRKFAHFQMGFD
jgi:hypothetical protein